MKQKMCDALKTMNAFLAAAAITLSPALFAENAAPKISGFLDAQYQYRKKAIDPGFVLNDGALYLLGEYGAIKGLLDFPFAGAVGEDSSFTFAKEKAQAYLTWTATEKWDFTVGQFDTVFGFEANDSKDLQFTTPGILFENLLPTTHLGGMMEFTMSDITIKALVSNANNKSRMFNGTEATASSEYPEFGAQAGYADEMFHVSAGMLHHQQKGPAGASNLYQVMAGVALDPITVEAEFDVKKVGSSDAGMGGLLNVVFSATEELSLAARAEFIRKVPEGAYEVMNGTFGPQYALSENLTFKADYSFNAAKEEKAEKRVKEHSFNAGALLMF
jgi:hypothetical protein